MSRRANSKNLDPMRFAPEAKQLSNLPGSPENTNPMNMRAAGQEGTPPIGGASIYNDSNQNGAYPQMGSAVLNPMQYMPSQMSNMPIGQKLNAGANYGLQPQPSPNAGDPMEGMRFRWRCTKERINGTSILRNDRITYSYSWSNGCTYSRSRSGINANR